jgi:hypothetical protein
MWRKLQGFAKWGFVVEEWIWRREKEQRTGFLQFEVHIIYLFRDFRKMKLVALTPKEFNYYGRLYGILTY